MRFNIRVSSSSPANALSEDFVLESAIPILAHDLRIRRQTRTDTLVVEGCMARSNWAADQALRDEARRLARPAREFIVDAYTITGPASSAVSHHSGRLLQRCLLDVLVPPTTDLEAAGGDLRAAVNALNAAHVSRGGGGFVLEKYSRHEGPEDIFGVLDSPSSLRDFRRGCFALREHASDGSVGHFIALGLVAQDDPLTGQPPGSLLPRVDMPQRDTEIEHALLACAPAIDDMRHAILSCENALRKAYRERRARSPDSSAARAERRMISAEWLDLYARRREGAVHRLRQLSARESIVLVSRFGGVDASGYLPA